jgi:hypothetical protein
MLELFGFPLGTVFQGGTLAALLILLAGVATVFIRGIPDRLRVQNEGRSADVKAETALRDEYAERYRETRKEVHGLRNELSAALADLYQSNNMRTRTRDRFNMVLFILRLVMDDLRHRDPESPLLRQAEGLLQQVMEDVDDPTKSTALNAAEHTVAAAKATCEEVKHSENGG